MIPESVTLIVKAPNQQIEDQNIECQSSWTVGQLKGHLSVVYPSKPRTDEQKIIYSGQLLDDNTILKDVLRTYDSQIAHTMHLVCAPKRTMTEQTQAPEPSTDGLRHRNVPEPERERIPEVTRPETRQNDQNHTVEMQNYLNLFANNYGRVPPYPNYSMGEGYLPVPNDPAALANHMIMMQQAYMQYMQQYANMWQATTTPAPAPEVPQPPQEPPPAVDDEEANRDWLDHLYAASRLAILFSLVYLYGSPARFLLILLLAAAGYLHQIGFFRDLQLNQAANQANQVNQPPNPANQPGNRANQPDNQSNQPGNQPNQPGNPEDQVPEQPGNQNQAESTLNNNAVATDNQQSLLAVTWMIFTSFFASLIPDTNV